MKKLSASVHQIEYFDRIILQIIADLEAVMLIVFPEPTAGSSSCTSAKLISDKAVLDCDGAGRKSSLRKHASLTPATNSPLVCSSRKSSKRDSRAVIIVEPDVIVSCNEYFAALDAARNHRMTDLKRRYESIGPLLIKLECLVLGTATGESFKMRLFYQQLEGATYAGLLRLVRNNLNAFIHALDDDEPLFQVDAQLMLPDILLRPTPNEIYDIIFQSVKDFLNRIAALKRWQPGTCIYYEDEKVKAETRMKKKKKRDLKDVSESVRDPPNFIDDIVGDETVAKLLIKIQRKVQFLVQEAKSYLVR